MRYEEYPQLQSWFNLKQIVNLPSFGQQSQADRRSHKISQYRTLMWLDFNQIASRSFGRQLPNHNLSTTLRWRRQTCGEHWPRSSSTRPCAWSRWRRQGTRCFCICRSSVTLVNRSSSRPLCDVPYVRMYVHVPMDVWIISYGCVPCMCMCCCMPESIMAAPICKAEPIDSSLPYLPPYTPPSYR